MMMATSGRGTTGLKEMILKGCERAMATERRCYRDWRFKAIWVVAILAGALSPAAAENWPAWRGLRGDGSSLEKDVPLRWSGTENVRWKTPIPGKGHASPIVWGDRLFVVTVLAESTQRALLCIDAVSGKVLWRRIVLTAPLERAHRLNSHASSTPATDGERVYVSFLDREKMYVAAYDFEGRLLWEVRPGPFASIHGYCSSPTLWKDKVILNGDHDGPAYLIALGRRTGRTLWKTMRPNKNAMRTCSQIV